MRKALITLVLALLLLGSVAGVADHPRANAVPLGGAPATLVTASAAGIAANSDSEDVAISADGRFVAFASSATNLAPVIPGVDQIYRKDLSTGEVVLVSANAAGQSAGRAARTPSISADGSRIAFVSAADNLSVEPVSTEQVFVKDLRVSGNPILISRTTAGRAGSQSSYAPSLSADGTRVAFSSGTPDLVSGATSTGYQVFVASVASPHIVFASVSNRTGDLANDTVSEPALSRDGSIVTFTSAATNLTADTHPAYRTQIWQRNLATSTTTLVSVASVDGRSDANYSQSTMTADGSKVVYLEDNQVVLRDLTASTTTLVSINRVGKRSNGAVTQPAVSSDGTVVSFRSSGKDLTVTSPRGAGSDSQLYTRDLPRGVTTLMSTIAHDTAHPVDPNVTVGAMSADGAVVVFGTHDQRVIDGWDPSNYRDQLYARRVADPSIDRVSGVDRFAVAAGLSSATYNTQRDVVYVATGADFPDALSASGAAGAGGGPVLLVTKDGIPTETGAELARLRPARIVIAGGRNSISPAVEAALAKYAGEVVRIAGTDRFEVSAAMSAAMFTKTPVETVYLASGLAFPDALGGAAATGGHGPVLLVTKDAVPESVRRELDRLKPTNIVVLGGVNAISDAVLATLPKSAKVTRVGGADRFVVSAKVSEANFEPRVGTVYVASGATFPDALSGSAAAIADHAPMLLVTKDGIPGPIAAELTRLQPRRIVVLGGTAAVSDAVYNELEKFVVG